MQHTCNIFSVPLPVVFTFKKDLISDRAVAEEAEQVVHYANEVRLFGFGLVGFKQLSDFRFRNTLWFGSVLCIACLPTLANLETSTIGRILKTKAGTLQQKYHII